MSSVPYGFSHCESSAHWVSQGGCSCFAGGGKGGSAKHQPPALPRSWYLPTCPALQLISEEGLARGGTNISRPGSKHSLHGWAGHLPLWVSASHFSSWHDHHDQYGTTPELPFWCSAKDVSALGFPVLGVSRQSALGEGWNCMPSSTQRLTTVWGCFPNPGIFGSRVT